MKFLKTRLGYILPITTSVGLRELKWQQSPFSKNLDIPCFNSEVSRETINQINCYSFGSLKKFSIPLDLSDWSEQMRKWFYTLNQIPNEHASRAAGQACRKNPIPIIIPCHRVVNNDDRVKNYSLENNSNSTLKENIETKLLLINLEKRNSNYSYAQKNLH